MTQEETMKRNEAIDKMLGTLINLKGYKPFNYREDYLRLMPVYERIESLGYCGHISKTELGHRVWFVDINGVRVLSYNRHEDLKTAIWLTVSDFAIDFNNRDNGN